MTDFEVANQITDMMTLFFTGFAVIATIVFAYVTAAFYFLYRAPMFTKLTSFGFFLFSLLFLSVNYFGAYLHFSALIDQVAVQAALPDASVVIVETENGSTRPLLAAGLLTYAATMVGVLAMAFWMTFYWNAALNNPPEGDE